MSELVKTGQPAPDVQAGDLIFLHRRGVLRGLIHLGQWLRPSLRPWARLTHVVCVCDSKTVIEAVWPCVKRTPLADFRARQYVLHHTHLGVLNQRRALKFLDSCVGEEYGALTFTGCGIDLLTPGPGWWIGRNGTKICSGIAAQMLEHCGWVFADNAASMSPARLARALNVRVTMMNPLWWQ